MQQHLEQYGNPDQSIDFAPQQRRVQNQYLHGDPHRERQIPPGWTTAISRTTGKKYYINESSGESQYEFPIAAAEEPAPGRDRRPNISHVCSCPTNSDPVDIKRVKEDGYDFYYDDRVYKGDQPSWLEKTRNLGGGEYGEVDLYEGRARLGRHLQVAIKSFPTQWEDFEIEE